MNTKPMQKDSDPRPLAAAGSAKSAPSPSTRALALPTSLIEHILAHVPHILPKPEPTYLFALMAVPPSTVLIAFPSILRLANEYHHGPTGKMPIVDSHHCASRLARPSPMFQLMLGLATPVLRSYADDSDARKDTREDAVLDRMLIGLCKSGNLDGLKVFHASNIVGLSARPIYKYMAAASEGGFVEILNCWVQAVDRVEPVTINHKRRKGRPRDPEDGLDAALVAGHGDVVLWWKKVYLPLAVHVMNRGSPHLLMVCRNGHVHMLADSRLELRDLIDNEAPDYMDEASAAGHVHVLDWFFTHWHSPS